MHMLRTVSLTFVAFAVAACSAATPGTHATATPATSPPVIRTLAPVAKLTAACPLLSASELKTLLGGASSQTHVTAIEQKPDVTDGYTTYNCKYGANGTYPFSLAVQGIPQHGFTPKTAIDAIAQASGVRTRPVNGVGEAGVFYTHSDGVSVLAASKRSHGETRIIVFVAPVVVPKQKFIVVAKLVIERV